MALVAAIFCSMFNAKGLWSMHDENNQKELDASMTSAKDQYSCGSLHNIEQSVWPLLGWSDQPSTSSKPDRVVCNSSFQYVWLQAWHSSHPERIEIFFFLDLLQKPSYQTVPFQLEVHVVHEIGYRPHCFFWSTEQDCIGYLDATHVSHVWQVLQTISTFAQASPFAYI